MQVSTILQKKQLSELFLLPIALSLILAISAQINVALYPVPITLQSLVILVIGLMCSPQTVLLAVGYYIVEIAMGLPFASSFSGGLAVLVSPRAGYFVGFLAAAYVSAKIATYSRSFVVLTLAAVTAIVTLYGCGIAWLSILFGFEKAVAVGLYPFFSEIPAFITIAVIFSYQLNKLTTKYQR